jgi:hypothetical protein
MVKNSQIFDKSTITQRTHCDIVPQCTILPTKTLVVSEGVCKFEVPRSRNTVSQDY